jgi:uncharacterized protein YkwD
MRRLVAAAFVLLAACQGPAPIVSDSSTEACFRSAINSERTTYKPKVPALRDNTRMNQIASQHSIAMAKDETIYHNTNLPNEQGVKPFAALGENVGMGPDCETLHAAFKESPGHYANIVDPDFKDLGLGVVVRDGTLYVTQVFYTASASKPNAPAPKSPMPKPKCTCPR